MFWLLWIALTLVLFKVFTILKVGKYYVKNIMSGKVVLVTGGNSGVGYEICLDMARRGAKLILTCADQKKGEQAVESIKKITKNNRIRYEIMDLTSLASVREFVEKFKKSEAKLDVLINSAVSHCTNRRITEDGILKGMQVNHFGPFLLTLLLVPRLKKSSPSRVINVTSHLHRYGTIEKINENCYGTFRTYANSKLCNVLFTNELARRLEGSGVVVNSADQGILVSFVLKILGNFGSKMVSPFLKSFRDAAQTAIYMAVSDDCDQVTGKYFVDCAEGAMSHKARDEGLAEKLWSISEELVKLRTEEVS